MSPILRIGLTGGIGSGKTTVTNLFKSLGVPVIDADVIARDVVKPGKPAYHEIVQLFGNRVLAGDESLRRDVIKEIIFNDVAMKQRLEDIIHPRVRQEIERRVAECDYAYCIISIPLLLETDGDYRLDRILVVDSPEEMQLSRTRKRDNLTEKQVLAIMQTQVGRKERLAAADDIIDNSGEVGQIEKQVIELHHKYLTLANARDTGSIAGNKHP